MTRFTNTDFADVIRNTIDRDIFELNELKAIFHSQLSDIALRNRVARSRKLLKLKKGLYIFQEAFRKRTPSKMLIANKLYSPSYVSFESALSYHGFIPEAVYMTSSACFQRKNKLFSNPFGDFSFNYIPSRPFFMGVEHNKELGNGLMATALKALFDLIYIRRKNYSSINDLQDDLRIDEEELENSMTEVTALELKTLAKSYKKKNVNKFYEILIEEFK